MSRRPLHLLCAPLKAFGAWVSQIYCYPKKRKPRRPQIVRMMLKFPDHLFFYYAAMPENSDIAREENELILALLPPANDNVPAVVRAVLKAF